MHLVDRPASRRRRSRGQALVEFALVIPIFLMVFVSIAEFTVLFTSYLSINFASHDAVQAGATYGNTVGADAAMLERIYHDVMAPADPNRITRIEIFWVDTSSPSAASKASNVYDYTGSPQAYGKPDGTTVFLPFAQTSNGYGEVTRCNVNAGVTCQPGHGTVDTIGVRIWYQYRWVTPFPSVVPGQSSSGPLLCAVNIMRLEPVL